MSLRVLHVITELGPGGAETMLYRLVMGSPDVEHEIICLADRDEWYTPTLERRGVRVHHLGMTSLGGAVAGAPRLNRLIRRSKADVVQCWMYRSNVLAGVLGRLAGIPVVWNIRCASPDFLKFRGRLWAHAGALLSRWVPRTVVNLSHLAAEMHSSAGYSGADMQVIHNGFDPEKFKPEPSVREAMRESLGIDRDSFLVGTAARWDPYKDIPNLLRAMRILKERQVPLRCMLVGHGLGADNQELRAEIDQAGIGDRMLLLGRRSDFPEVAQAMDVHVFPSASEGFGNVVAETMLCGTPNITTHVGACPLMLGDTGWIVPPQDPERLAEAILDAYTQWKQRSAEWEQRRAAARERIAALFSFERMTAEYEEVWTRAAGGRS